MGEITEACNESMTALDRASNALLNAQRGNDVAKNMDLASSLITAAHVKIARIKKLI
ncbi:hypothetical protein HZB90_01260 [archaeon]|nr:hypothetical protein [archaeon]